MKITSTKKTHVSGGSHTGGAHVKPQAHGAATGHDKKPHHKGAKGHHKTSGHRTSKGKKNLAAGVLAKPSAEDQLVDSVASRLLSGGFAAEIIAAIEAVLQSQRDDDPGRLLPGVVSNLAGAIQAAGGGEPAQAMVFLNGSSVAVPAVIPTYLLADIAAGQEVWVVSANGRRDDLMIHSIRAFTSTPASSGYETSTHAAATYETSAHAAATYATLATIAGLLIASGPATINGTTAGTLKWAMPLQAAGLKIVVMQLTGYRNASATPQAITLPADFTAGAIVITLHSSLGGTGFVFRDSGAAIIQANQVVLGSAGAGGSATANNNVFAFSLQSVNGAIHSVDGPINGTTAGTGPVLIIGF
jgi:hypothetical protein